MLYERTYNMLMLVVKLKVEYVFSLN